MYFVLAFLTPGISWHTLGNSSGMFLMFRVFGSKCLFVAQRPLSNSAANFVSSEVAKIMRALSQVDAISESELDTSFQPAQWKKMMAAVATVSLGLVAIVAYANNGFMPRSCVHGGALQGKFGVDLDHAMSTTSEKLIQKVKKNQSMADETIMNAMLKAGHKAQSDWERNHVRKLPTLTTIKAIKGFRQGQKKVLAEKQECAFNVLEAFVSAVGMGDDINAIIRTCPAPRDGESELACQVNGGILGAWVGNLATKLALAASNCAITLNVDAVCSAGVTGLVSAMGEIAAGASLGAATCAPTPPSLTTTKISVLGDQTVRGRRLLIGEGAVGNGVQCGVDVGMVAANIANMGIAINKAVNVNKCKASTFRSPIAVFKGIPQALCTVDIGGAVAYIGQVVTFINLIVVHCQDFLDVNALCAGSIAAITTGAAAIAPYGAAVHAGCAENKFLKNPKSQALLSALWTAPEFDPLKGEFPPPSPPAPAPAPVLISDLSTEETADRRLQQEPMATPSLEESLAQIAANRESLEQLKKATLVPEAGNTEADMETLLNLMGTEPEKSGGNGPLDC